MQPFRSRADALLESVGRAFESPGAHHPPTTFGLRLSGEWQLPPIGYQSLTPDGAYAYHYVQFLSDLYDVAGLR